VCLYYLQPNKCVKSLNKNIYILLLVKKNIILIIVDYIIQGIVHPKMNILLLITQPYVVPNQ